MSRADPNDLNDFWDQSEQGPWEIDHETTEDGDSVISRRKAMGGIASLLGITLAGGANVLLGTQPASADVATGGLTISGDTATSDGGQLTSITLSTSGHVSYDGLDTDAATCEVNVFAAKAGNTLDTAGNRVANTSLTVTNVSGMDTRAGHYNYSFSGVDLTTSDDIGLTDFRASTDGGSSQTDVSIKVELEVYDSGGTKLVEGSATDTATVTVNNQSKSAGANGSGNVTASGSNQSA